MKELSADGADDTDGNAKLEWAICDIGAICGRIEFGRKELSAGPAPPGGMTPMNAEQGRWILVHKHLAQNGETWRVSLGSWPASTFSNE